MLKHLRLHTLVCAFLCVVSGFALPVDDITLVSVSPSEGNLDANLRSLSSITLTFSAEVEVGSKAKVTLSMPNGETLEAVPVANRFMKKNCIVDFPDYVAYNGHYTLTINRWSVGDAEWIANREEGHSNPKIEVEWDITNGLSTDIAYDINPVSIKPENNAQFEYSTGQMLSQVTIVFPNGTLLNPEAHIGLSCTEARFDQDLIFFAKKGSSNTTFSAYVAPVPTISGNYNLVIPGGSFGDQALIDGEKGHGNPPIDNIYVISGAQDTEGEVLETMEYTLKPKSQELTLEEDIYTYTLTWAGETSIYEKNLSNCMIIDELGFIVDDVNMTLLNTDSSDTTEIQFTGTFEGNKKYSILIVPAMFGNQKWEDSNYQLGVTNPVVLYSFIPNDISSGIEAVTSSVKERASDVYTSTGIMLYRDATEAQIRALAPGFYIIGGRKVVVR